MDEICYISCVTPWRVAGSRAPVAHFLREKTGKHDGSVIGSGCRIGAFVLCGGLLLSKRSGRIFLQSESGDYSATCVP